MPPYDLIVIGSGPAGEKGSAQAAYFGKRVALVEKEQVLGGAAANTGTLPSKTLRETALYLSGFRQRGLYGISLSLKDRVTVRDFLFRERLVKESERTRVMHNLRRHGVDLYIGAATFIDAHTVAVRPARAAEIQLCGDVILIATGSTPHRPALYPFHDPRVYDSDTILNLHDIPPTMLVVGGGVIGCEYACMFAALGIRVTLVESRDRLLGFLDGEISQALLERMTALGIDVRMPDAVAAVRDNDHIHVVLQSGAALDTDTILVASGRGGNTETLGLDRLGIETTERGHVVVNQSFQTAVPHVYAAGDVIGFPALASTSMEQARLAMCHAFNLTYKTGMAQVLPYGIFTIPECSMAGETEESLQKQGVPYVVGRASYGANARGQIIGDTEGFLKLIFRRGDWRLLGVHIIGELATELVHVGLTALLMQASNQLFIETCYNYPTLTELYKYATYHAMGRQAALEKKEAALAAAGLKP